MKTLKIFGLYAVCTFAMMACNPETQITNPTDEPDTPTDEPVTPPADTPATPEKPVDVPEITTEVFFDDVPVMKSLIGGYDGQKADDADKDVVGTDDKFYWEANEFDKTVTVVFSENSATVSTTDENVLFSTEGAYVELDLLTNSMTGVEVVVSGQSSDGQLKISGEHRFKLVLNGLDLTCTSGPAIENQCSSNLYIHLQEGTVNTLKDSGEQSSHDSCFYSKGNMAFSGTGVLIVEGWVKHGIHTSGFFYMRPGVTIAVTHAQRRSIYASGDPIGAQIDGGLLYAKSTEESSDSECIKCNGSTFTLNGGYVVLYAYDDGIQAADDITINGGHLYTYASIGDGLDTNGTLNLNGGKAMAFGMSPAGDEIGFDCDSESDFKVNGGLFLGFGGSVQKPFSTSKQRSVLFYKLDMVEGTVLSMKNAHGTDLFKFTLPCSYVRPAAIFFSSKNIYKGNSYDILIDDEIVGHFVSEKVTSLAAVVTKQ